MFRGDIPGYYWDAEKKKYFKVQANHVAPANAKYSKQNVKREEREAKKRRVGEKHDQVVRKQTVPAARLLKNPILGGAGLRREHGDRSLAYYSTQRDSTFVNRLERHEVRLEMEGFDTEQWRIGDALQVQDRPLVMTAISHGPASHVVYLQEQAPGTEWQGHHQLSTISKVHAFHDSVIGLLSCPDYVVAFTGQSNHFSGNAVIASVNLELGMVSTGVRFNVGAVDETLWDCKLASQTNNLAFATDSAVRIYKVLPTGPESVSEFPSCGGSEAFTLDEAFALDWLNNNTLAVGTRRNVRHRSRRSDVFHEVVLCDLRSGGKATRLERKDRITGIHSPNDSGTNLLVSGSRKISLYDLRVMRPDAPLLSLDHLSGTTRLHTPTQGDLLAATDKDNKLQTYSLRTGKHLRTLNAPSDRGLLQRPRWQEDWRGSLYLQACASSKFQNTLQQWKWEESNT